MTTNNDNAAKEQKPKISSGIFRRPMAKSPKKTQAENSSETIKSETKAQAPQTAQQKSVKSRTNTKKASSGETQNEVKKKTSSKTAAQKETTAKTTQKKQTSKTANQTEKKTSKKVAKKAPIKIIPLGGLNEIGKNMTCYECGQDMFIVDCGLTFPEQDMLGVDLVIPDFTYVESNFEKVRGIFITHGHEDHIGGIAYLLKKINVPVYGTKLVLGLLEDKLKEHGLLGKVQMNCIKPHDTVKVGCMTVEFIRVNHSIPDAVAMAIFCPSGIIIQTGDFKVDYSPIEGEVVDIARFAELGKKGVLCLLSDSTNAERPGSTISERKVGASLDNLFSQAENKRIIVATFASNIHRIQQIIDNAVKYGRKVAVSGRSMENVTNKAIELGYLNVPKGILISMDMLSRYPKEQIVVITTGSQGEPMSALSRMATGDHRSMTITPQDFIIISATPIPGNEKHVTRVVNDLLKLGAEVIYESMYEVHVSGHACQDELKMMLSLTKPKFFIPVHGEFKHLKRHAELAEQTGVPKENILIGEIGQVIEIDNTQMKVTGTVPAGRVFVDGLGVGDVGSIVLRDRKHLSEDGLIVVVATIERESGLIIAGPDIVSRGFVYVRESEELMYEARKVVQGTFDKCRDNEINEWGAIKLNVRDALSSFIYKKTKRSPMILPILMEV